MGDFPGHAQIGAVLGRLRSELKLTVLTAAAPRVFDGDWLPTGGGYGLTLPTVDAAVYADGTVDYPENWGAGRITSTIDTLCPILEAWRFAELDTGLDIEDGHLAATSFTAADIYGKTDAALGENLRGCGYMLLEQEGQGPDFETTTLGRDTAELCGIRITIRVPRGAGQGQGALYAGLLARVLGPRPLAAGGRGDCVIGLGGDDYLQFGQAPELAQIEDEAGQWLGLVWETQATRRYVVP